MWYRWKFFLIGATLLLMLVSCSTNSLCRQERDSIFCEGLVEIVSKATSDTIPQGQALLRITGYDSYSGKRLGFFYVHISGPSVNGIRQHLHEGISTFQTQIPAGEDYEVFVFGLHKEFGQVLKNLELQSNEIVEVRVFIGSVRIK